MIGNEPIDIENCHLPLQTMKSLVVNDYVRRDIKDFEEKGINNIISMMKKATRYGIQLPRRAKEYSDQRDFRLFYSFFSLDDLYVLGY